MIERAEISLENPQWDEFQRRIRASEQLTLAGAKVLSEFQELQDRDKRAEKLVADRIYRTVRDIHYSELIVGVESVELLESAESVFEVPYAFRSWIEGDKSSKMYAQSVPNAGVLIPINKNSISGNGFYHGFQQGKELGYGEALGDSWYFAFGGNTKFLVPVNQLESIKLRPKDNGF